MAQAIRQRIITRPNIIMRMHRQPSHRRHAKITRVVICATKLPDVVIGLAVAAIDRMQILNAKRQCQREDVMQSGNGTASEGIRHTDEFRHKVYNNKNDVNTNKFIHRH